MTMPRILGDWGTTRLRLWLLDGDAVVAQAEAPGIKRLTTSPAATIAAAIAPWGPRAAGAPLLLCGMAGARDGWIEAPYADCPAGAAAWRAAAVATTVEGRPLRIAAGLACTNAVGAPDVMRGEETQLFGAMRHEPALARGRWTCVLPGTHSKWAQLDDGRVTRFTTALTGELFDLLHRASSLIGSAAGEDAAGFADGVARAADAGPAALPALLFETRSRQLRAGKTPAWAAGFLSGLLIGAEIAALAPDDDKAPLLVIGGADLAARYCTALTQLGRRARAIDGTAAAISGLMALGDDE